MNADAHPRTVQQRTLAAFAILIALCASANAEYAIRSTGQPFAGVILYLAAALLIAITSARFHLRQGAAGAQSFRTAGWLVAAAGAAASLGLAWRTFSLLRVDTGDPDAFGWWLASLAPLLVAVILCWWLEHPHTLWEAENPQARTGRIWLAAAVVAILVVAALTRFLWLDRVPFGINPDEGDRTAVAIQIVRDTTPAEIFEAGWYYISMLYFELMAVVFRWFGIGFVQARAFTAAWGLASVAISMWLGLRHFSWRVGVLAGILAATTGVVLQFSRLTTEAGPTATLWLLSLALMLEGARRGRTLPWVLAGMAGGFSLYFYPTGRVWAALALAWGLYLLVRWLLARRSETIALARGLALAAVAALVIATPYLAWVYAHPHELTLRYAQTTVFDPINAARLGYYDPAWSDARLFAEQLLRTLGIFNHYADGGGVWPIFLPILAPVLALLVLLGVGITSTRWRDPRATFLGIAFWVGVSGVMITVETPNLIRMATAIPLLPILAALTLEEAIQRARDYFNSAVNRQRAAVFATIASILVSIGIGYAELRYYFGDYAQMNLWSWANQEGRALTLLPANTRYTSLGGSFHMVNSGWVRLIAPEADRAGFKHPGSNLPFLSDPSAATTPDNPVAPVRDMGVLLYPGQEAYLPWLQTIYPDLRTVDYRFEGEHTYFTLVHLPSEMLAQQQGVIRARRAASEQGEFQIVRALGELPEGVASGAPMQWSATWRVPQQWNYLIRLVGPTATLALDGMPLLANAPETPEQTIAINLARGDHALLLNGIAGETTLEVARQQPGREPLFAPIPAQALLASDGAPQGLAAQVTVADHLEQRRQDNTLATCCLADLVRTWGRPTTLTWSGTLLPPAGGDYGIRLQAPAPAEVALDGEAILSLSEAGMQEVFVPLDAPTPITITVHLPQGGNGALELMWQPPGEPWSILPHIYLSPDASLLWSAPLAEEFLLAPDNFPSDIESETIR